MRIKHKHSNFFLTDGENKSDVAIPFHLLYFSYLQDSMIPSYDCLRERTIGEERCSLFSKIRRESENKRESTCSLALADSCPRPIPAFLRPSLYECALHRPLEPSISVLPSLATIKQNRSEWPLHTTSRTHECALATRAAYHHAARRPPSIVATWRGVLLMLRSSLHNGFNSIPQPGPHFLSCFQTSQLLFRHNRLPARDSRRNPAGRPAGPG